MGPDINEGDIVRTGSGERTIAEIDGGASHERPAAVFEDGGRMNLGTIATGVNVGRFEHVPNGGERDTFIRFGDVPEGERSWDSANGRQEDGVSVYGAVEEDGVWKPTGPKALGCLLLLHRGAFLVSGVRVGTGADGEPVIKDVEMESKLETPEGVAGFVETDE